LDFSLPATAVCLLTDDGSSVVAQLASRLTARGWKVVVISFPETVLALSPPDPMIDRVLLDDVSEAHLQQQLATISQTYGSIAAFIHLHPKFDRQLQDESATAILKHVFLMAKYLKRSLTEPAPFGRSAFLTVTRLDGQFGLKSASLTSADIISGGLFGLTKTLNLEWPQVFCRAVDIAPDRTAETVMQTVLQKLYDPDRSIVEVGYSAAGRVTLECGALTAPSQLQPSAIDANTVFLVSGGGKGITAQCIIQLSKYTQSKFILLGRTQLMDEPDWARGCDREWELKQRAIATLAAHHQHLTPAIVHKAVTAVLAQREIAATLQAIRQAGGDAEYISVDLTAAPDLRGQLTAIEQRWGAITGIIHGAGNLADKSIENKSARDFELVYTTKIVGLRSLLNSVDLDRLQHLVLFSSAAGFYGNIGQADYAIANEILNKFAHQFKHQHPDTQTISFNWGPWDSGMVTPEVKRIFAQRKIEVIPTQIGTQIFVDQLLQGNPDRVQVLVGSPLAVLAADAEGELKSHRIRRRLNLAANPFLQDHRIGQHVVLPNVCSVVWIATTCEQMYPGYRVFCWKDLKVLKGIVFDESLADEYILSLDEVTKVRSGQLRLKCLIWSELPDGKFRYHYSTEVTLVQTMPPPPQYESFDLRPDPAVSQLDPYRDGTLFHGSTFQGIVRVLNLSGQRITLECVIPWVSNERRSQFHNRVLDAIALDVQYQGTLIWVRQFHQAGSLPLSCQLGEQFQPVPIGKVVYVSIEVVASTPAKLVANIVTHDDRGLVYARVLGAEVTISQQLNRLFSSTDKRV
jgi:NAD(P)-dependent dehydrogenase (short-subunit alcohol dehydrogenase family)